MLMYQMCRLGTASLLFHAEFKNRRNIANKCYIPIYISCLDICDTLIEQGLTSPPAQHRLSGRQFYRSKDPTNSINVLQEKNATKVKKTLKGKTTQNTSKQ